MNLHSHIRIRWYASQSSIDKADIAVLPNPPAGCVFKFNSLFWVSIEEALVIRRYPWLLQIDPTAKTNRRNIPFVPCVGADGNWQTACWGNSLLGEGERNIGFTWILSAIQIVHGQVVYQAIALIGSDGDEKIIQSIDTAIANGELQGKRNRCLWHLHEQKYANEVEAHASKEEKEGVHTPVKHTISTISTLAETLEDIEQAFDSIRSHLNQYQIEHLFQAQRISVSQEHCNMLQSIKHLWVKCLLGKRTFGCNMSCRIEAEQNRLKVRYYCACLSKLFASNCFCNVIECSNSPFQGQIERCIRSR
jgi:hypothetical protein